MNNKIFRALTAVLLSLAMIISFTACGGGNKNTKKLKGENSINSSDDEAYKDLPIAEGEIEYQTTYEDGDEKINLTYYKNGYLLIEGNGELPDMKMSTAAQREWLNVRVAEIGEGITSIGKNFFSYCSKLVSVSLPDSLEKLSADSFYSCSKLPSIEIPENVESISSGTFTSCDSLKEIRIPAKVNYISDAFSYCNALEKIIVDEANENYMSDENGILYSKDGTKLLTVPAGCHLKEFTVPSSVTTISGGAFNELQHMKKIVVPISVTEAKFRAFNSLDEDVTICIQHSQSYVESAWDSAWQNIGDPEIIYNYQP